MKPEDKSTIPRVKIVVLGHSNVGKSALTVRYLTRRYIGEYRSNTDLLYKQTISLESGLLDVEIVDVSAKIENEFPLEQIQWSDACVIVYSITDPSSFEYATKTLAEIKSLQSHLSAYLIGNKADLDHLRKIKETEGASLAASYGISFCEVSASENTPQLYKVFENLLENCRSRIVKQRKFSVTKMLGTLIGSNSNKHATITQGTVVPCHKGELKSLAVKRRQGFTSTATASL